MAIFFQAMAQTITRPVLKANPNQSNLWSIIEYAQVTNEWGVELVK
jgi:hypothetical protein